MIHWVRDDNRDLNNDPLSPCLICVGNPEWLCFPPGDGKWRSRRLKMEKLGVFSGEMGRLNRGMDESRGFVLVEFP